MAETITYLMILGLFCCVFYLFFSVWKNPAEFNDEEDKDEHADEEKDDGKTL